MRRATKGAHHRVAQSRHTEADTKLKRLNNENGIADLSDPLLKDRIGELKATRDQASLDAARAQDAIERADPTITPQAIKMFARTACKRMRTDGGRYRRYYLRVLAQRVEVERTAHHGIEKRTPATPPT